MPGGSGGLCSIGKPASGWNLEACPVNCDLQEALDAFEAPGEQVGLTLAPKWRTGKQLR
jgi:hypothetical protein